MNAGEVNTNFDQHYNDVVTLATPTDFKAGGSTSFGGPIKQPAGSTAGLTVTGGQNTETINLSQAEVPVTLKFSTTTTTNPNPVLIGGKVSNTFIKREDQHISATFVGGGEGSQNFFDVVPASDVKLVDKGGYNTINLSHATVGITLDLTLANGETQHVYQEAPQQPESRDGVRPRHPGQPPQ